MDVQTKLRENRKAVMLKQYKLDSMKHRAKALNPKITSVIYSDNADNVLITYNNGKCKKTNFLKDINDESKLTSTTLKTDGKRVSNIQLNKMFPTSRYAWTYDEKAYVVKPGVVYEVGSGNSTPTTGDINISNIMALRMKQPIVDAASYLDTSKENVKISHYVNEKKK